MCSSSLRAVSVYIFISRERVNGKVVPGLSCSVTPKPRCLWAWSVITHKLSCTADSRSLTSSYANGILVVFTPISAPLPSMNPFGLEVQENWIVAGGLEVVLEHLLASDGPLLRLYISSLSFRNFHSKKREHDQTLLSMKGKSHHSRCKVWIQNINVYMLLNKRKKIFPREEQ